MDMSMGDLDRLIEHKIQLINGNGKSTGDSHAELAHHLPRGTNFAKCNGSDCNHMKLTNPSPNNEWKSCPNCSSNTVPQHNEYCPTCGTEDRMDPEFWDDSDVNIRGGEN